MSSIGIAERFKAIVRVTRFISNICGIDVFDHGYHINWRTAVVFTVINLSILFLSYTGYVGYRDEGDWRVIMQVLSIGGGTLLQGYCKFMNFIRQQKNIRFLLKEIHAVYEEYELKHSDYRLSLRKSLKILANLMKLCAFFNSLLVFGMAIMTLIFSLATKTRILVVYGEMPGVDHTTRHGYCITVFLQICFVAVGGFGFYVVDMSFITPTSQIMMLNHILKCKFHDLNDILSDEPDNKKASMDALKDVIQFHQKYLRILRVTQETYYWVILVQMLTYPMGIVCTLICVLMGNWPGGYVYLSYCFVMMYLFCGIGTMINISNENIIDSCYNEVRWYDLSITEKKMLRTMLMMAQKTQGLMVGSVVPLSINTGLQVTKTIYSIAMLLINFAM